MFVYFQAGIPGAQLVMSLEAEAAAIFCKYLPLSDMAVGKKGNVSIFKPGSKYLVLDVGGKYQCWSVGFLSELYKLLVQIKKIPYSIVWLVREVFNKF